MSRAEWFLALHWWARGTHNPAMALPALRNVQASPVEHQGQNLICLYDPQGFVDEQLVLTPAAFFIATNLNGENDVVDIQAAFARQFRGAILPSEDIRGLVDQLDEQGFLATERFDAILHRVGEAFARAPAREAYAAGKSYPAEPPALREYIEGLFVGDKGPGEVPREPGEGQPVRGFVAPHIDYDRGGHAYAHAYFSMYKCGKPKTAIIFGVAHMGGSTPFILTRKNFETPFGVLETDQAILDRLEQACDWDPYEDELVHRTEHSIEFQAVMLAHLYGPDIRIVPILCAQLSEDVTGPGEGSLSQATAASDKFLETCRDIAADPGNGVTTIASADLAHVGRQFGDPYDITESVVREVAVRDEEDLAHVANIDPQGFYRSVMKDGNQRRVCGLGCIYATLRTVEGSARCAELLCYDYAPDPLGGIVSFAGIMLK